MVFKSITDLICDDSLGARPGSPPYMGSTLSSGCSSPEACGGGGCTMSFLLPPSFFTSGRRGDMMEMVEVEPLKTSGRQCDDMIGMVEPLKLMEKEDDGDEEEDDEDEEDDDKDEDDDDEEEEFLGPFDIDSTKNTSIERLKRWRQAALVTNASRRFRYTLDLKMEEEKDRMMGKIRAHAQIIRQAMLFQLTSAGQTDSIVAPPTPPGEFTPFLGSASLPGCPSPEARVCCTLGFLIPRSFCSSARQGDTIRMLNQHLVLEVTLKLDVKNEKAKKKAMRAISQRRGVQDTVYDSFMQTLRVTGEVDPVDLALTLRKIMPAAVLSVGPARQPNTSA